ncbi:MAG TPA: Gfo/Idh/MocA family oxidoreductase [Candidatus Binataceae bacterium]|nr:Gfo/Idh/MocA family oxidoreductase [Candidatus Binataceae bacterium]
MIPCGALTNPTTATSCIPWFKNLGPLVEIAAISDLTPEGASTVAREAGIPAAYLDAEKLIAKERPNMLDICTPPAKHANLTLAAMEQGRSLLIEKPLALTLEDCDRIVETSRARNLQYEYLTRLVL